MGAALLVAASPLLSTTATAEPLPDFPALGAVFPLGDHSAPKAGFKELAPGVTYRVFTQGVAGDVWTVWVRYADGQELSAAQSTAAARVQELRAAGFGDARVVPVNSPATADTYAQTFYGVHVGSYAGAAEAKVLQAELKGKGFADSRVLYTAETNPESRGPWQIRVVTVRPDAQVDLRAEHGASVSGSETVRQLSASAGALAAVNGTEFDIDSVNNTHFMGHEGVPQGLYMRNNVLLGAPNNGRTALLLNTVGSGHRITEVKSRTWITAPDGSTRDVDGINRVAGQILGCGGVGDDFRKTAAEGDLPRLDPWRNGTCYDPNEIVVFRPEWGTGTDTPAPAKEWAGAPVTEVVMNGNWDVLTLRDAPGPIPAGGRVLQGIGKGGEWLKTLKTGDRVTPHTSVTDMAGTPVTSSALAAFGGGTPALMRDGQVWLNPAANGTAHVSCALPAPATGCRPSGVLTARHPRTLAGISAEGHLMLVTIDGRNAQASVGVTLPEAARVMEWLGARDAVGLGSGGDTTLMVENSLYNRPWDQWEDTAPRERAVSNAVVVVKRP
ncbi:phosphodiester glycosidase family protein [Streptomyces stackebrandtii]|uniref:phosphodiester glycosidase family protein n=1 Tax=Streptomyces stackebrandtii TaxID=3051177 RepID=UPI0028DCB408|nr:phosphodiester glycosidase family protein [Streptomyces sp. DSM 40976]